MTEDAKATRRHEETMSKLADAFRAIIEAEAERSKGSVPEHASDGRDRTFDRSS